jgi:hypothetical protein
MDIVLENYLNSICCNETLPLNRIEFTTGNAPTIEGLETILGFTLLNPVKTGDLITFDNVGYHIPDNAFDSNEDLISFDVASGVTAGDACFQGCTSLISGFDNLISAGNYCFQYSPSLISGFNNLVTAGFNCFYECPSLTSGFNNLTTAGDNSFGNCTSLASGFDSLTNAEINCFQNCTSLTSGFDNLISAGSSCFYNCTSLTSSFNSLQTAGDTCFENCTSLTGGFDSLISVGNACFRNCTSLSNLNFDNVDNYGMTTGDDSVFLDITGKTITVTAKSIHQTSNGGSLEGDLQYLSDNNTVTFIWV